ncbi:TPA: hypothetical protein ACQUH4_000187 [Neisseria cinerea]
MICLLFNAAAFIPTKVGIYRESRNFSAVMPAQAGIRTRPHGNLHPVIPTRVGIYRESRNFSAVIPAQAGI